MSITKTPQRFGAALTVSDSDALAELDPNGLTVSTKCFNLDVGGVFTLTVSDAALDPDVVVAVAGYDGMRWIFEVDPDAAITSLTGDVTGTGPGATATTVVNLPAGVTAAGRILATAITAPATPSAGIGSVYVDSTSKNLAVKDDAGVVKHGVQSQTATANKFVTAVTDAGAVTQDWLPATAFLSFCSFGINASVTPGPLTATGVKIGDKVVMVANVTDHISSAADFESTVTVADQIQQATTDLSAKVLTILVIKQSV